MAANVTVTRDMALSVHKLGITKNRHRQRRNKYIQFEIYRDDDRIQVIRYIAVL